MLNNNSIVPFYLGDWCVVPEQCQLQNSHDIKHIQPKLMEVLLFLSENQQHVLSTDDLIQACWAGQPMTDNPIHKTIAQLRKALGDSSDVPKYIKTIPRKGYMLIAKVSRGADQNNQSTPFWRDQLPFLGLHAFQHHHKDIFWGRDQSMADFLKFVERIDQTDSLLIFLSGTSGCGKTSFIQAGIVPKLLNPYKPFKLKFVDAVIWKASVQNSAESLLKALYLKGVFEEGVSLDQVLSKWEEAPSNLVELMKVGKEPDQRMLIFLDQLEKLLLEDHTNQFLHLIAQLNASKKFLLILSSRDEGIADIKQMGAYEPLLSHTLDFRLTTLKASDHIDWVEATTQAAGLFFEVNPNRQETLFDLLKHSIQRHECSLSAVQTIMHRLYESRDNSTLTYASFHDLGGLEGILNQHMEEVFLSCSLAEQETLNQLFPELIRYQSIVDQSAINRRLKLATAVKELTTPLLDQLIEQRLLQSELVGEQVIIRFNEWRMTNVWQRLGEWVVRHQDSLSKNSELHFLTARWLRSGKQAACLIGKQQQQQMMKFKAQGLLVLNDDHQQFLQASDQAGNRRRNIRGVFKVAAMVFVAGTVWLLMNWQQEQAAHGLTQSHLQSLTHHLTTELNPQLKAKGQLTLLEGVSTELLKVFDTPSTTALSAEELVVYASTLNVMGELSFNQRKYQEAHEHFARSVAATVPKIKLNNKQLLQELMLSQYWLGYLGFIENQYGQARSHWNDYLQTALQLRELAPEDPQWQLEHSYALNNLGSLSERTGALTEASDYFAQSIEIKTDLLEKQPDDMTLQADLADSLSWQGNIYRKQGALKQALTAYEHSADLTRQLKPSQNNNNTKLHREALAIHRMASITLDMGLANQALDLAVSAIDKSLLLNQLEPQNNNYKKELISLHLLNATIYRNLAGFDQSLSHIQKANELIDYFKMNLKMTPQIAGYLMMVKREQALIFNHFGQTDSAITAINNGLSTWEAHELKNQHLARVTYVMLNLDWSQIMQAREAVPISDDIQAHLDEAWREINALLESRPQDAQVMAIALAVLHERSGPVSHHKFIQILINSEYRNPEYYQPLIDDQLITLN